MGEILAAVVGTMLVNVLAYVLILSTWAKSGVRSKKDWVVIVGGLAMIEVALLIAALKS